MINPVAFAVGFSGGWVNYAQPDPENGLVLTENLPTDTDLGSITSKTPPFVFAVDFTGLNPTSDGIIWENGGMGRGCSLCVEGTDLVLRAGDGGAKWPSNCSYIVAACPTGDGTLVWEVNTTSVRMWWNGNSLGPSIGSHNGDIAGGNESRTFGLGGSSITEDSPETGFTGFASASLVRYYEGQVVSL